MNNQKRNEKGMFLPVEKPKKDVIRITDQNTLKKILRNLARCRNDYKAAENQGEIELLLENTMSEIQDLLDIFNLDFRSFPLGEKLEG